MGNEPFPTSRDFVEAIYRSESRQVLASLIRLLGDFDLAEDAMLEAFTAALEQWPRDGVPAQPRSWLISTGRFKGIDRLRREVRMGSTLLEHAEHLAADAQAAKSDDSGIEDDCLRLIFTCCHPVLPSEAQVALTLREVCGLTTEEIARAFLTSPATLAQRIVRAKSRIRESKIAYEIPGPDALRDRLADVLSVTYLVFNEGYYASSGPSVTRQSLSGEAIRLGRLIAELLPHAEAIGLLALMLLQESRRSARTSPDGDLILLEDQDRSKWDAELVSEGSALIESAFTLAVPGAYVIQAAIAAIHAAAPTASSTDWGRIVELYDRLSNILPSPVVDLNRAVAIAMYDGPIAGLKLIDELLSAGELSDYGLAHAARADLCRRLGRWAEARISYQLALDLATQEPEQRFLQRRLRELPI